MMGMYSLIEDAQNERLAKLVAFGMTEDEAIEQMREEDERAEDRFGSPPL